MNIFEVKSDMRYIISKAKYLLLARERNKKKERESNVLFSSIEYG